MLLQGQRAVPHRLMEMGYAFRYPEALHALRNLSGLRTGTMEAIREGDIPGVQLRRRQALALSREEAWRWLVEPEKLALWLADEAEVEPGPQGSLLLRGSAPGSIPRPAPGASEGGRWSWPRPVSGASPSSAWTPAGPPPRA